jgi:MarR family transcriptional regulator, temperature-dependent positive regulator of motility
MPGLARLWGGECAATITRSPFEQTLVSPTDMPPGDDIDLHLLREIAADPATSQRSLARRLGVSLGRVNFCLRALADKGLVKADNFRRSDNKRAYAYVLTPQGVDEKLRLTMSFLQRKMVEYDQLQVELEKLRREVGELSKPN